MGTGESLSSSNQTDGLAAKKPCNESAPRCSVSSSATVESAS